MPSQREYHLLPQVHPPGPMLLSRLRRRHPEAERQLLEEYNRTHPAAPPIRLPLLGATYSQYAPVHLGLLWMHARNLEALAVLAGPLWSGCRLEAGPLSPASSVAAFYRTMPLPLLRRLWEIVQDPEAFRGLLHQGDPAAVEELVQRCHTLTHLSGASPLSEDETPAEEVPLLLALLWSIGGNAKALEALALQELDEPLSTTIQKWPTKFLERLWHLARDGDALVELWRREGVSVNGPVNAATPARVLGYRSCFLRDAAASQELIRRYQRVPIPAAAYNRSESENDHRAERALRILQQIREWDFRTYPDLAGWLCTVERNARIDHARRGRHAPLPAFGGAAVSLPDPEDPHGEGALRAIDQQDDLDCHAAWRQIVVQKLKDGIRLSDREIERVVRDNLELQGVPDPSEEEFAQERARVCRNIESLRTAKKPLVQSVLKRHKPVRHSQLKRITKLRLRYDVCTAAIRQLPAPSRSGFDGILADFDVLFGRSKGEKWLEPLAPAVFVARLQRHIREALTTAAHAGADAAVLGRCSTALHAYLREFPLLLKTGRVYDLVNSVCSHHSGLSAIEGALLAWLDANRQWLSTLRKSDGKTCERFIAQLETEAGTAPRAELALQLLWLQSIVRPGRPDGWLTELDEALQLLQELDSLDPDLRSAADTLTQAALAGNALRVTTAANRLWAAVVEMPASREVNRLRDCLKRLGGRRAREHAFLDLCRELADRTRHALPTGLHGWLERDGCLGETEGPAVEEGRTLRRKLRQAIDPADTPSQRGTLLRLLDLTLGTLLGEGLPGLTAESLGTAWTMCHADPRWPAEIRELADELTDTAWQVTQDWSEADNWSAVAEAAGRLRKRVPHCAALPTAVREELGRVLGRLTRGPRLRTSGGK